MKDQLVVIDPEFDFCHPSGALYVTNANKDIERLAKFVERTPTIEQIHCTLDCHHRFHIAHPMFWKNSKGERPNPFTLISLNDVLNGKWMPCHPALKPDALNYVKQLDANKRYVLCIWPEHCLIGHPGSNVMPELFTAFNKWIEHAPARKINFVAKGSNWKTEHYSAVQADVPDPEDPGTQLNVQFIEVLEQADRIFITGQALSHCVANTVRDIAAKFGDQNISKFILLEDTTSNVPGFEHLGQEFVKEMRNRGMKVARSTDF